MPKCIKARTLRAQQKYFGVLVRDWTPVLSRAKKGPNYPITYLIKSVGMNIEHSSLNYYSRTHRARRICIFIIFFRYRWLLPILCLMIYRNFSVTKLKPSIYLFCWQRPYEESIIKNQCPIFSGT